MALDREGFTARRVGPLDLNMLDEQRALLTELRTKIDRQDDPNTADALDGMIHLTEHLQDCWDYAVQEEGFPRRQRMLIHAGRASDELRALAGLADEGDDEFDDLKGALDRFDTVKQALDDAHRPVNP